MHDLYISSSRIIAAKESEEKKREAPPDRLSELPDSLIFEIFGLLEMRDVVRTTILSKSWENLWNTTPYLNFDGNHKSEFVNRALTLWKGLRIIKFKISASRDGGLCLPFVKDRGVGVEELSLEDVGIWNPCLQRQVNLSSVKVLSFKRCKLPQIDGNVQWRSLTIDACDYEADFMKKVVSCSSLEELSLKRCILPQIGANVQWKSLTIDDCDDAEDFIKNFVWNRCPRLEVLIILIHVRRLDNLSIRSSSLKKLLIENTKSARGRAGSDKDLKIWSPNLESLNIVGAGYAKYSLMNVSSLTHLSLEFTGHEWTRPQFARQRLGQILQATQHVDKLTLSGCCIKVLVAMINENCLTSLLSNLKSLTMKNTYVVDQEYAQIVNILQLCPQLETFAFESNYHYYRHDPSNNPDSLVQVEGDLPDSFLLQLQTLEVTCIDDTTVYSFIGFLLKHASHLQKMVLCLNGSIKARTPLKNLLSLPRSSLTAEFIVAE